MAAEAARPFPASPALMPGVLLIAVALLLWMLHRGGQQHAAGAALFHHGDAALVGRLAGHAEPLPAIATRCVNCHALGTPPDGYAVALDRQALTASRSRRGGPPSAFDAARLCTLLRDGVDPAQVMIASVMPRYEASVEQCEQLWAYLTRR